MPYSSREILRVLGLLGFETISQRGSHLKLRLHSGDRTYTVIVKHPSHDIPNGTFAAILRQAGISRADFERLR